MNSKRALKQCRRLAEQYCVQHGHKFRLKDFDPRDTGGYKKSKQPDADFLEQGLQLLSEFQEKLYAQDRYAVLLVFQAMDAAGKDSTIKHVMSGVNPQGCQVYSFKAPSPQELDHDFLWRTAVCLPERGRIGIFNRSYYEEVLVVRVHPELLAKERLPDEFVTRRIWKERFEDINAFEQYLTRNGVVIRKFFLYLSRAEQKQRFLDRLDRPDKHWKFSLADVQERQHWKEYMAAYEDAIRHTATPEAPWYVVPADNKWFARMVVAATVIETLASLRLEFPEIDKAKQKELAAARRALVTE
jgi:PPK2 family polyphosphate:nucleotide phosphotransferase